MDLRREFGCGLAADEDWASPQFDHVSPPPQGRVVGDLDTIQRQWRESRPYLIQHIRNFLGDPKWDPRGARVLSISPAGEDR